MTYTFGATNAERLLFTEVSKLTFEQRTKRIRGNLQTLKDFQSYLVGKVSETFVGLQISHFLDVAKAKLGTNRIIFTTDLDKIVRVGDDFKAIFEIKYSANNYDILVKYNQWRSIDLIKKYLGCKAYIVCRNGEYWYVEDHSKVKFKEGKNIAHLKLNRMEILDDEEFIKFLAELIR